jgi:hypothetical protein
MKKILLILIVFISLDSFCQISSSKDWPKSIQKEFNSIKNGKIDTFLVYYSYLGPWSNLPEQCDGIPSVWVLWIKNKECFARKLYCDSTSNTTISISSVPFDFFISHIKDFELRDKYIEKIKKEQKFFPPIPTDGSWEYLYFMTSKSRYYLNLSEHQRIDKIWKQFPWIKPTIDAVDTTIFELNRNKNVR